METLETFLQSVNIFIYLNSIKTFISLSNKFISSSFDWIFIANGILLLFWSLTLNTDPNDPSPIF